MTNQHTAFNWAVYVNGSVYGRYQARVMADSVASVLFEDHNMDATVKYERWNALADPKQLRI